MTQVSLDVSARADHAPIRNAQRDDHTHTVADDIAYQRLGIVNVAYVGKPGAGTDHWVLVDAGLPGTAPIIRGAVAARFGAESRPVCIVMTHAHADHAGALEKLADELQVPVYAHTLELPYLNGIAAYPPPDTGVGGGAMPALSVLFPRGPFDVSQWVYPLPVDGSVPCMPGWKWIHTPGHTPGHISLWREGDRTLLAGDAFITTDQESVYAVLKQKTEMHGPPMYYTQHWGQAELSVQELAALEPELAVTGHGHAMRGEPMRAALRTLAQTFRQIAVPHHGKYFEHPTTAETGSAYVRRKD
jgi:glyoxylase-like metal-dependent hydrolase (beta-lactamase superfamily II)